MKSEFVEPIAGPELSPDGRVLLNAMLLKDLRKGRALSQEALAELCLTRKLCVSIGSIKRAETGKPVLYRTARHLAQVFDLGPEQLQAQPAPHAAPDGQALVGRMAELRQFQGLLSTLQELRRGHVICVRGAAGVGKTRLMQAFRTVGQQARIACHAFSVRDAAPHVLRSWLHDAVQAVARPLLITIDDIDAGLDGLLAWLGALIVHTRNAPVVWVLSSTNAHAGDDAALRACLPELPLSVFEMAALDERESTELASHFAHVSATGRQYCVERARGNPLRLTELLADAPRPADALPATPELAACGS
ncbi:MAG TPA: hypothetical protein VGC21_04310 [Telluria sp.]|jgi:transcriptional regulator with XRE-family HTH domain